MEPGCRKRARFFGRWAGGGLCLDHTRAHVAEFGDHDLHAADRARFQAEPA